MKILYAPSGKRMIPYPPVGPAVLAAAMKRAGMPARAFDLEILAWTASCAGPFWPADRESLNPKEILAGDSWTSELTSFVERLARLFEYEPGEPIAISTMGYEQLLATMAITRLALANGSRVILGGQYWTEATARRVLEVTRNKALTITTSDGYEAIVDWFQGARAPINSFGWNDDVFGGDRKKTLTQPPTPNYEGASWPDYDAYAQKVLRATALTRRAHLYVWDKQCPYRCTFCRVSTGSNVKLSKPESLAITVRQLLAEGVRQLNFMTNELNPTLAYMRRFVAAVKPHLSNRDDVAWFTYLRPDHMEAADLQDLRAIGCRLARYGVETGSQRLSDLMRKDYVISTIERVLKAAAAADIMNHVNFLVGFPGETEEDVEETLAFIDRAAEYIHSVRINPFYLPPDSPMARDPSQNGVRLTEFKGGFWDFETIDGQRTPTGVVEERIERITTRLTEHGIGFSAVLPFETLDYLARYSSRDAALEAMLIERPFMWENSSSDWLKARLGGYDAPVEWRATIYRRGKNYSLTLCSD